MFIVFIVEYLFWFNKEPFKRLFKHWKRASSWSSFVLSIFSLFLIEKKMLRFDDVFLPNSNNKPVWVTQNDNEISIISFAINTHFLFVSYRFLGFWHGPYYKHHPIFMPCNFRTWFAIKALSRTLEV